MTLTSFASGRIAMPICSINSRPRFFDSARLNVHGNLVGGKFTFPDSFSVFETTDVHGHKPVPLRRMPIMFRMHGGYKNDPLFHQHRKAYYVFELSREFKTWNSFVP